MNNRTPDEILAEMDAMMEKSNHPDFKTSAYLKLAGELQAALAGAADETSRRNQRIAQTSLGIAVIALAIAGIQLLLALSAKRDAEPVRASYEAYERQSKVLDEHQARAGVQLQLAEKLLEQQAAIEERAEKQAARMEALTKLWEQQAARYDAILGRWEQQQQTPPKAP